MTGVRPHCESNSSFGNEVKRRERGASKRALSAPNSERSEALLTLATGYSACSAMIAANTASRSPAGIAP